MKELNYGDLVFGEFPFEEDGRSKNRWVFVLHDHGDKATVAYCTTNPGIIGSVRLGQLADGKVTNLVPYKWETILKTRISTDRIQRVPMPVPGVGGEILGIFKKISEISLRNQNSPEAFPANVSKEILDMHAEREKYGRAQFAKIASKKAAMK